MPNIIERAEREVQITKSYCETFGLSINALTCMEELLIYVGKLELVVNAAKEMEKSAGETYMQCRDILRDALAELEGGK